MASFSEMAEMGWSRLWGGEEAAQETAIENLNDKYPGLQTFYNTMRGDLSLANALETVIGNNGGNIDVDGRNRDGTEVEGGGLDDYDRVDEQLSELTGGNPRFFHDVNALLDKPGVQDLLKNAAADPDQLSVLRNMTSGEGASSPAAVVSGLNDLLEEDPQAIVKWNRISTAPGAEEAFARFGSSADGIQDVSEMLGFEISDDMSQAAMINMIYERVDADNDFLVDATEAYGNYETISAIDGFDELSQTLQQNPALQDYLGDVLGVDTSDMTDVETLSELSGRLEELADHDPAIFEKMNRVLQADGAEEFLATVAGNEALSNIISGMADGEMGNPESVSKLISGLDERIARNSDYMEDATDLLQRSQGLIATFGEHAAGQIKGPDDVLSLLDQAIQTNNLFTGLQDGSLLSGIGDMFSSVLGPEYSGMISDFLAGIQEFLGPLFERIGGMLGGIMDADAVVSDGPASMADALNPEGDPTVLDQDGQEQRPAGQQPQPQQPDTDRDNDMGLAPT